MKFSFRFLYLSLILIVSSISFISAQDLTGIWRGHFRSNEEFDRLAGNYDDRYKIEVQIAQTRNHFMAVTYSYKSTEFYGKAEAAGTINTSTKKVLLKEGKLIEVRSAMGGVCVMTCFLQYSKLGKDEYLQGTYYSTSSTDSTSPCGKGSIFMHRVTESDFHKEPFLEKKETEKLAQNNEKSSKDNSTGTVSGKPQPAKPEVAKNKSTGTAPPKKNIESPAISKIETTPQSQNSSFPESSKNSVDSVKIARAPSATIIPEPIRTRTNEVLKTLSVNNSEIELRIYDDGAIDNDTVSVYYDNKLLISRARLSDQPVIAHIKVESSELPHQLVMVAENLGEIPPNTSLLVVIDGSKRYEERIISNEQKNIVINFKYRKIE